MNKIIRIFLFLIPIFMFSQHENDNWTFGNSKWNFDNSTPNGFTHTARNPYIRYISSVISDKNTGNLLFYCDGNNIYDMNNNVMQNGGNLFGVSTQVNTSDQSSIILKDPSTSRKVYYVFLIAGNRPANDSYIYSNYNIQNYGLRYVKVDLDANGGLGSVTIPTNNVLFSNSPTTALTSTYGNGPNSYWIVTKNGNQFLSYKLDASGLSTTPVPSTTFLDFNFIKISPDSKKLVVRNSSGVYLHNFNNSNGKITNEQNIIPATNYSNYYGDGTASPNSAEFSANSNILYFISAAVCSCTYNVPPGHIYLVGSSGLSMYNISNNSISGVDQFGVYEHQLPSSKFAASLQLGKNEKIYLIYNAKQLKDPANFYQVDFENNINNAYYSYDWGVIDNPNNWNPNANPLNSIPNLLNTKNGFSFPQLIPIYQEQSCPSNYVLETAEPNNSGYIYQASNTITTKTNYSNDYKTITMNAGASISMLPNTYLTAGENSFFLAQIKSCPQITEYNFNSSRYTNNPTLEKDNLKESDIKIYPNPASNFVNIDSGNKKLLSWELFDLSGKLILKGNTKQINLQSISRSSYLLKINFEKNSITKKLIVK